MRHPFRNICLILNLPVNVAYAMDASSMTQVVQGLEQHPEIASIWPKVVEELAMFVFDLGDEQVQNIFKEWICRKAPDIWPTVFQGQPATKEDLIKMIKKS